ncbi:uncharacterized protein BKA55DRAFT_217051 [Fusarium redolens]|uniref:Rhodopsin domain-containing protein n=1 Tax=Fusarium redolens TaxID=48865 RepID=A0A9P9G087_FUSRE|nr:uncharacterized protein BKA55DRAFT_217051 [Fusarium redolens]KAH7220462.1 hypothetical protein BKA55DRAFT_217051 [Fusarium redolens]
MYFLDLEQPLLTCPEYRGTMTARGDIWQRDDSRPPAGPPPPGITSDFLNPPSTAHKIIVVSVAFSVLSSLFIALRLYTILSITHQRGTDDYLLVISWVLALVYSVLLCAVTKYGLGRHLWDIPFVTFNRNFMKLGAVVLTFYGITIMLTKTAILVFLLRFVTAKPKLRLTIHFTIVTVAVYSLIVALQWVYACQPIEKFWDYTITTGTCIRFLGVTVFSGVMNSITDAVILVLPVFIMRGSRLPKWQKLSVTGILMTGGLVLIIGVIRAKITVDSLKYNDLPWQAVPGMLWWTAEVHLALICACLPFMKPFLQKFFPDTFTPRPQPSMDWNLVGSFCGIYHKRCQQGMHAVPDCYLATSTVSAAATTTGPSIPTESERQNQADANSQGDGNSVAHLASAKIRTRFQE